MSFTDWKDTEKNRGKKSTYLLWFHEVLWLQYKIHFGSPIFVLCNKVEKLGQLEGEYTDVFKSGGNIFRPECFKALKNNVYD